MELRRHPDIKHKGTSTWPPSFGGSYGRGDRFPQGEEGELVDVEYREDVLGSPPHVWISIRYQERISSGPLLVDDIALLPFLASELGRFIGGPLAEAGSMDLDAAIDALRAKISRKLRDGRLPRATPSMAPLASGSTPAAGIAIGSAKGPLCDGCDRPIATDRPVTTYGSVATPIRFCELCERLWREERHRPR